MLSRSAKPSEPALRFGKRKLDHRRPGWRQYCQHSDMARWIPAHAAGTLAAIQDGPAAQPEAPLDSNLKE
jgi:hypothetical protein